MSRAKRLGLMLGVTAAAVWLPSGGPARAQSDIVHAVLFYSPTCPHCHRVILYTLPDIFARFGGEPVVRHGEAGHIMTNERLELLLVDVSWPRGQALYQATTLALRIPPEREGVPRLVCGDAVLVGDLEIPERFPGLITGALEAGGLGWPALPGLSGLFPAGYQGAPALDVTPSAPPSVASSPAAPSRDTAAAPETTTPGGRTAPAEPATGARPEAAVPARPAEEGPTGPAPAAGAPVLPAEVLEPAGGALARTMRTDPVGGALALVILGAMLVIVVGVVLGPARGVRSAGGWAVPLLIVAGVAVAGYLAYVEATGALAVCGPVGDCNAVQQSRYARLFGVVPVALVGIAGYLAIFGAWALARAGPALIRPWGAAAAFLLALVGTLASAALTALEPFVIGAVCAWCLASAAIMAALLWLLRKPARRPA